MVKKALLIGINYKRSNAELRGCINDVRNMIDLLTNNFGFEQEHMRILTEEFGQLPTKTNILEGIWWLVNGAKEGDTLVMHFSGHGYQVVDTDGSEDDGMDEVLIPLDFNTQGYISDDMLFKFLVKPLPKGVQLFVLMDCCHSGTILDLKYNFQHVAKCKVDNPQRYKHTDWTTSFLMSQDNRINTEACVVVLSGSLDSQYANDAFLNKTFQGALTYCFIDTIRDIVGNKQYDGQSIIKWKYLLKDISCKLLINGFKEQTAHLSSNLFDSFNSWMTL